MVIPGREMDIGDEEDFLKSIMQSKRIGRAATILDLDDYYILEFLIEKNKETSLSEIKKKMNFSHNALIVHMKRLSSYGWIRIWRKEYDHKFKNVEILPKGKKLFSVLKEGMDKKPDEFRYVPKK